MEEPGCCNLVVHLIGGGDEILLSLRKCTEYVVGVLPKVVCYRLLEKNLLW